MTGLNSKNLLGPDAVRELLGRIGDGSIAVSEWNNFSLRPFNDKRFEKIRRKIVDCAMTSGQCSSRPASPELQALAASIVEQWDWWCFTPDS